MGCGEIKWGFGVFWLVRLFEILARFFDSIDIIFQKIDAIFMLGATFQAEGNFIAHMLAF